MNQEPRPKPSVPRPAARAAARSSAPPAGVTWFLGHYRVVDTIGVGGMATVHLARVDGVGGFQKWVAIKRIHADLIEDDQFVKMFLDEARIAASISHPNVAQVFELGQHEDTYWIAMEYLHGEPIREIMRRNDERGQRMGPPLAAKIVADAAEGLHAAHELRGKDGEPLNLVHRDVTPHNLFITYDGTVKVVDFGIAKVAGRLSSTMAGTLKGKIAYMSPEQIMGNDVDRRADIFSLGVVLWELSTGQRLFRSESEAETLGRVRACIVPPPSMILPSYPAELEAIVMRALSKDRRSRQETARELSRSLQQFLIHAKAFVGSEEISEHVTTLFADRLPEREAHLRWAAEVTRTQTLGNLAASASAPSLISSTAAHDDAPPRTVREPRHLAPDAEGTSRSTTEPLGKGRGGPRDPLLQTRREPAYREAIPSAPEPPPDVIDSELDDDDEPRTVMARAAHAPRPVAAQVRSVDLAPKSQANALDDSDDDEEGGDTMVVSEAEMAAAMGIVGTVSSFVSTPEASDEEEDDDDCPTMALAPQHIPVAARRGMAAPELQADRVRSVRAVEKAAASVSEFPTVTGPKRAPARAPSAPGAPAPSAPVAPAATRANRPQAAAPAAPRFDPGQAVAEVLAQSRIASPPAVQSPAVPFAAPLPPAGPQAAAAPGPMVPVAPVAPLPLPPSRTDFSSADDADIDYYARQRARRVVLIAAVIGGLFIALGAGALIWVLVSG